MTAPNIYIASAAEILDGKYYCLPHELDELQVELAEIGLQKEGLADEITQAMSESSETWHDNAPAEAVFGALYGLDSREAALVRAARARIDMPYPTPDLDYATLGSRVECELYGDRFFLDIVGNIPIRRPFLDDVEQGSVAAPMPRALLGSRVGQLVIATLPDNRILEIKNLSVDQMAQAAENKQGDRQL